jgi:hypothetical protein
MTLREIKSVTDLAQQQELRRNAWESASVLLVNDKAAAAAADPKASSKFSATRQSRSSDATKQK